ncbi:cupin domain-containing protein [Streptomyces sp. NRRL S-1448]|uniref:cupin domain-containing protein n=1 Tax=Streptomyces sp. NRRL S-1448 TaxID=1463883 RepID=UPI0004C1530B|nr:cupin domain-containing protein [Streptomyces sp. NRRL S-1448]
MTVENDGSPGPAGDAPVPRVLCDAGALTARAALDGAPAGALWRLAEPGRQLDANVVRIPPAGRVDPHTEPDLDVLLLVVAGDGTLLRTDGAHPLGEGSLVWLPHGSTRGLVAGAGGLGYLTVHRRRPGMQIRPPSSADHLRP